MSIRFNPIKSFTDPRPSFRKGWMMILACALLWAFLPFEASARKTGYRTTSVEKMKNREARTKSKRPADAKKDRLVTADTDAALFAQVEPLVVLEGYDKRGSSTRESFMISNRTDLLLTEIHIELTYLSESGEELHVRELVLPCYLPPKGRRKFDVATWDPQHSYSYYKSTPMRKSRATLPTTPYRISTRLLGVTVRQ